MKLSIKAGATSESVNLFIQDSSKTDGSGLTGLAYNTASLVAYYSFTGANASSVAITLATLAAVNSAYSSGGFKEIDATNMPGWYRFDLPNAALATSKGRCSSIHLKGATNMAPCPLEIELTGWDNQDAVHGGLSALPNTAVTTNASLLTSGTGTDQLSVTSGRVDLGKILGTTSTGAAGYVGVDWGQVTNKTSTNALTGTTIATTQQVDVNTIKTQTITCSAGVTVGAFVGNATAALGVDASGRVDVGKTLGTAVTLDANNVLNVSAKYWAGTAITATSIPVATAAGASGGLPKVGTAPFPASGTIAAAVADEVNTAATHNVTNSLGKQIRLINPTSDVIYPLSGTVNLASATSTTAVLDAGASNVAQAYQWNVLSILSGTGSGQSRLISNYAVGRTATITPAWATTPDNTSTFEITPTSLTQVASYVATQDPAMLVLNAAAASYNTAGSIGQKINAAGSAGDPLTSAVPGAYVSGTAGYVLGHIGGARIAANTALPSFAFMMYDSTNHRPQTGLAVTPTRSLDGAAFAACANGVTEMSGGWYKINLAAADLNGTVIALRFTAPAADDTDILVVTQG